MLYTGSIKIEEIIEALIDLGNTAEVNSIKERVIKKRGGIPSHYKSERSCKETIQRIIENHCPESDNYSNKRIAYFSRIDRGVYRLLPENERIYQENRIKKNIDKKPIIKRSDAVKIMANYYSLNKLSLPKSITEKRNKIIELIMKGNTVEDAFNKFIHVHDKNISG